MNCKVIPIEMEPYGEVKPRLYGHFAEHLGRCCYDGIWDRSRSVCNFQVENALKAMPTPLLRWPGGCYADRYHWRDGVGRPEDRPVRLGMSCGRQVLDDNSFGTHEFLGFCERIGAEPYLAGNMGSGSVQELCDWIEYCNCELPTTLAKDRISNGQQAPWGVKLWGIGNENWGCGGHYDPESYALEYRRYSLMAQMVDPSIEMVFCGHTADWNAPALDKMRSYIRFIDHFSVHCYWIEGGPGTEFSEVDYYRLLREADNTEAFIVETRKLIDDVAGDRKKVGIALDEWGVWHPESRTWGPGETVASIGDYSQACTMRDALAAAAALEVFHRQCSSLSFANLAQVVNVLHAPVMTDEGHVWLTPTYYLLQMHRAHLGATAYRCEIEGGELLPDGNAAISGTATTGGITVMNRHLEKAAVVFVRDSKLTKGVVLFSDKASDGNGPDRPERVKASALKICREGDGVLVDLPPHSVATLTA